MAVTLGSVTFDDAHTTVREKLEEVGGRNERRITVSGAITMRQERVTTVSSSVTCRMGRSTKHHVKSSNTDMLGPRVPGRARRCDLGASLSIEQLEA